MSVGEAAVATSPARRPRWFRVAAIALSAAATLGALEAALALADVPRGPETTLREVADPRAYDADPRLLWRPHRDATLDVADLYFVRVHTDSRGLRNADRRDEWTNSRLRVLCLGDSVTFGVALADDETYPARLERALVERLPADVRPVVMNAGVPGYSSVQGERLLDELAPLAPDVIAWWFGMNDGKPALGPPDSRLDPADVAGGGALSLLRRLRTVRFAESLGAKLRGATTRTSLVEQRGILARVARRATPDGPSIVFVGCPSRLDEKLAQLDAVAAIAKSCAASRVEGGVDALSEYVPGPPGCDLAVRIDETKDGRTAVLAEGRYGRETIARTELLRRRDAVREWKKNVDAYVAALPADALSFVDLFGATPPDEAFSDNCHMTAASARVAADALARRIAEIAARRPKR